MEIVDKLKRKNMKVEELPKKGNYLRNKWVKNFANHLSAREKEDIYLVDGYGFCGYLWHLFSFNKKDCLEGEQAEQAFNNEEKRNVMYSPNILNMSYYLRMLLCLRLAI